MSVKNEPVCGVFAEVEYEIRHILALAAPLAKGSLGGFQYSDGHDAVAKVLLADANLDHR